ncbi:hypothetical protein FGO68_gene8814 [Halteria grandinella]|uniref:Carboxypeptidase regulatory-like domain-containing protein n=1 Tax=Halteria grandinella TaxID=5974 RepID=A0A8J8P381_HALGN|nr:hypothetical protein FGO68_gene8814 [Halteria grandinella]
MNQQNGILTLGELQTFRLNNDVDETQHLQVFLFDALTLKTVSGATVSVTSLQTNHSRLEQTDAQGLFKFRDLSDPGAYKIIAAHPDYQSTQQVHLHVNTRANDTLAIYMLPQFSSKSELYFMLESDSALHLDFKVDANQTCKVGPLQRLCGGISYHEGKKARQPQIIKMPEIGNTTYLIYAEKSEEAMSFSIRASSMASPIIINNPKLGQDQKYWIIGCLKGSLGLENIEILNSESALQPNISDYCI